MYVARAIAEVFRGLWSMVDYGAPTNKPHYAYSNSDAVQQLSGEVKKGRKRARDESTVPRVQTCEIYHDSKGEKRFKGTTALTATERLS